MAAELISRFPGLVYVSSRGGSDLSRIPVEYALLRFDDDLSSTIFKSMRCERYEYKFSSICIAADIAILCVVRLCFE